MTSGISMKFSGKMWCIILLKVTKSQDFTLFLYNISFGKIHGRIKLTPPSIRFLNFLYLSNSIQKIFFFTNFLEPIHKRNYYFWIIENISLSFFSNYLGENNLVYSYKSLHYNTKLINLLQRYPHKIVVMLLLPIKFLISCGINSSPKLSKSLAISFKTKIAIQWAPTDLYLSRFITYIPSFVKLF